MKTVQNALLNSFLSVIYIFFVGSLFSFLNANFANQPDTFLAPIFMLTLLVFSVALMGILIFGKPVILYLNGKKNEATRLLFFTITFIFIIILILFIFLFYY